MHADRESEWATTGHFTLRVHPDVISQRLGDSGVLVNVRTGRMFELNVTGIRVWELVSSGCAAEHMVRRLTEEFTGDEADVRAETAALIDELVREGLLHAEPRA
jgi:Coenzyme PQQ synthesis protein D (PqqD)